MPPRPSAVAGTARALRCVVAATFLSACPQKVAVWIAPGSTAADLRFELGHQRNEPDEIVEWRITVKTCGDSTQSRTPEVMWEVDTYHQDRGGVIRQVRYGVLPDRFQTIVPAKALAPGCYVSDVANGIRFVVNADLSVVEVSRNP